MGKQVIIAVTNDLVTDQRVNRVSLTLLQQGYNVTLVGRLLPDSRQVDTPCRVKRFRLLFNKGSLFYANYNIRLFFYLLFRSYKIVLANDLDTLPACYLASFMRRKKLVYDSHEYYTEVPELVGRSFQRNTWKWFEQIILPKVKYSYTVCDSIAKIYNGLYGTNFEVIRNLPLKKNWEGPCQKADRKIIIYQGALNIGRGIELMIESMLHVHNAKLWIVGSGDIEDKLKALVKSYKLDEKVIFIGRVSFNELHDITCQASLGLSLEENIGLNYYYALPNKLFDYVQARIPVVVANLPEMRSLVLKYQIGEILDERGPQALANKINSILNDKIQYEIYRQNLGIAASELIWEKEEKILIELLKRVEDNYGEN